MVNEQSEEKDEEGDKQNAEKLPLEILPNDVLECLERIEEPKEGGIRSTVQGI